MNKHRCKLAVLIFIVALGIMQEPAFGWEFSVAGSSTFISSRYSQGGSAGFFGPYDVDNGAGTAGNFAPANAWLGPQAGNMVSGSVGSNSSFSTSLFPAIRINPAISLQGVYRIGNSQTEMFPGATVSFASGEWLQWWATINTPVGLVAYGKRPFTFGCGLQFDSGNRTQENLALVSYYGPLTLGLGVYQWRPIAEYRDLGELYWNPSDNNGINTGDIYGFFNYEAGPLEIGAMGLSYSYHSGPERGTTTASRIALAPLDVSSSEGSIYMKYNNGRFFLNAEADWIYRTARWQKSQAGTFLTADGVALAEFTEGSDVFRPQYTESWRYMLELGTICGPTKLSLLAAYVPGPDRRHGVLIDRQPVLGDLYRPNTIYFSRDHGNSGVFRPYSLLLSADYGSGLGATSAAPTSGPLITRGGDGYIVDAVVYAARLDYAIAANLNFFGSFLYANRLSHGYGWGYIRPTAGAGFSVAYLPTGTFAAPSPAIPDNGLGWEATAGVDWKIVENWTFNITAAYWQPGKWFSYACIDKAVPGWDVPFAGNNFGTSPDRSIDGIFGLVTTLTTYF
jgi:hypothetical protein